MVQINGNTERKEVDSPDNEGNSQKFLITNSLNRQGKQLDL